MPLSDKQREEIRKNWLKIFYGNSWSAESVAKYWLKIVDQELDRRDTPEFIICAAVRASDGKIVRGHRHHNAIRALKEIPGYQNEHLMGDQQGFVTSKGRYVTRKEGCIIQKEAGIDSVLPPDQAFLHGELYSEDLY